MTDETKLKELLDEDPEQVAPLPDELAENVTAAGADSENPPEPDPDEDAPSVAAEQLSKDEKGWKNEQRFLVCLIAFLVVIWILFFKIIGITHMPNDSMEPRVDAGDLLVFYRLDKKASFQDIIVFEKKIDGKKTLCVGRVMAAPGDTVDISDDHRLVVNGNSIIEYGSYYTALYKREDRVNYPITLGPDEYFVLADNRDQGVDSRYYGPVNQKEILGTLITLFRRNKF